MRKSFLYGVIAFASLTVCSVSHAGGHKWTSSGSTSTSTTMTYNGTTYTLASSSTCPDGSSALRYKRKWWCPVTSTTSSTSSTTSTSTGSTSTSTSTTTTSTSGTTTTTTTPTTYSAQLSWNAPTTRADGTPLALSDIAGYEIYYTTDDPAVAGTIQVSGGSAVSYTLSNLVAGNYYFAMSAIDTTGLKSALSTVAPIALGQ